MIAESSSSLSTFAAESICPGSGRVAWIWGKKLVRDPCNASSERAQAMSAVFASRRARTSARLPNAAMNCVPLTSESPSFASSSIGSSPTAASAAAPSSRVSSTEASPSPTSGSARCASGARSPLAPTDPRLGTCGKTPRFRHSIKRSTVCGRAPEKPFASAFARRSIAALTTSSGYGSPTPQAWLRSSRSCSSPASSSGMERETKRPKPVLMPYVCSFVPCAARSTSSRARTTFSRAAPLRAAGARSTATAQTSSIVRLSPVSWTAVRRAIRGQSSPDGSSKTGGGKPARQGALAEKTPKEETDPAPDVHRMLLTLRRSERLPLELARLGLHRLAHSALAVGLDLGARRGLEVLAKLVDLRRSQRQANGSFGDLVHLLRRHVARLPERARRDREPVEDVGVAVADHLVDLADLAAVRGKYLPAGLDH